MHREHLCSSRSLGVFKRCSESVWKVHKRHACSTQKVSSRYQAVNHSPWLFFVDYLPQTSAISGWLVLINPEILHQGDSQVSEPCHDRPVNGVAQRAGGWRTSACQFNFEGLWYIISSDYSAFCFFLFFFVLFFNSSLRSIDSCSVLVR